MGSPRSQVRDYRKEPAPKPPSFTMWLLQQGKRDDIVGSFARYAQGDLKRPRGSSITRWVAHLEGKNAPRVIIQAAKTAWDEFNERKAVA